MAVTVAVVNDFPNFRTSSIIATADADVAAVVPHGMGEAPQDVAFENGGRVAASAAAARISDPTIGVIDATNVNVGMTATAGSGAAGIQNRVNIRRPHSISR